MAQAGTAIQLVDVGEALGASLASRRLPREPHRAALSHWLAAVAHELGGGQYCNAATIRGLAQPLGTRCELPCKRLT